MKRKLTRKQLIELCQKAVVHHTKWNDRDSYLAQKSVQSIYAGLTGNVSYTYTIEDNSIWITFKKPTKEQKDKFEYLSIDSIEDYFEWYKNEYGDRYLPEMFDGYGIDWNSDYLSSYLPTPERLEEVNGSDWY
jgi:trehalose-6-phosphate synthase